MGCCFEREAVLRETDRIERRREHGSARDRIQAEKIPVFFSYLSLYVFVLRTVVYFREQNNHSVDVASSGAIFPRSARRCDPTAGIERI